MRIFFDTEFTSLTPDAKLISIGFAAGTGQEFYAELSDTYLTADCSEFCQLEVLPHLEGGVRRMTLDEVRGKLYSWLTACGPGTTLVCDSPRDIHQLRELFPDGVPANVSYEVLGWWSNLRRRVANRGRRIHRQLGFRVHHALDDARVNRLVLSRRPSRRA